MSKNIDGLIQLPIELAKHQFPELRYHCDRFTRETYIKTGTAPRDFWIKRSDFEKLVPKIQDLGLT